MQRSLIVALVLSVALNIFAVGYLSGRTINQDKNPAPVLSGMRGAPSPFSMMRHAEVLSPETRDAFRDRIRKDLPSMRRHYDEQRRMAQTLATILAAPEFDRAAAEELLSDMQGFQSRQYALMNDAFLDAMESLSGDERKLLVDEYIKQRERRHERRRHRRGDKHGPPER